LSVRKTFFFEKKNQKTFVTMSLPSGYIRDSLRRRDHVGRAPSANVLAAYIYTAELDGGTGADHQRARHPPVRR
jgi:hypothetical protein